MNMKDLQELISQHVFCYASKSGQGYVKKESCSCHGTSGKFCEAYLEMNEFHEKYKEWEEAGLSRKEIIQKFDESLEGKESKWFQYNVIK